MAFNPYFMQMQPMQQAPLAQRFNPYAFAQQMNPRQGGFLGNFGQPRPMQQAGQAFDPRAFMQQMQQMQQQQAAQQMWQPRVGGGGMQGQPSSQSLFLAQLAGTPGIFGSMARKAGG